MSSSPDISRVRSELAESERLFRLLAETASDIVYAVGPDRRGHLVAGERRGLECQRCARQRRRGLVGGLDGRSGSLDGGPGTHAPPDAVG